MFCGVDLVIVKAIVRIINGLYTLLKILDKRDLSKLYRVDSLYEYLYSICINQKL